MITPPFNTACFYTVVMKDEAAQFVTKVLAPLSSKDINSVLVTSTDFRSDIEATNELHKSALFLLKQVLPNEQPVLNTAFNPLYLPNTHEALMRDIEVDTDGDITSIAGFSNPFITMTLKAGSANLQLIDAKVNFKQFELPSASKLFNPEVNFLS